MKTVKIGRYEATWGQITVVVIALIIIIAIIIRGL